MSQMGRMVVLFSFAGVPVPAPVTRETLWAWRRDGTEDLVAVMFILQKGIWKPRDGLLVTVDEVLR